MTWFRVYNKTRWPLHVAVSRVGAIEYCANNLPPGTGYAEFDVVESVWFDVTGVVAGQHNEFRKGDASNSSKVIGGIFMYLIGGAGVALTVFPGAAAAGIPFAVVGFSVGTYLLTYIAVGSDTNVLNGDFVMHPITVPNFYAPYGYNVEFTGAEVVVDNADPKNLVVVDVLPLALHWTNNTTGVTEMRAANKSEIPPAIRPVNLPEMSRPI